MDTTDKLTLFFMLACSIGPLVGFLLAVGRFLLRKAERRGVALVIGGKQQPAAELPQMPRPARAMVTYEPESKAVQNVAR